MIIQVPFANSSFCNELLIRWSMFLLPPLLSSSCRVLLFKMSPRVAPTELSPRGGRHRFVTSSSVMACRRLSPLLGQNLTLNHATRLGCEFCSVSTILSCMIFSHSFPELVSFLVLELMFFIWLLDSMSQSYLLV